MSVYSVSTIGSTYQLSVGHNGVVQESDNRDGFQSTLTAWTPGRLDVDVSPWDRWLWSWFGIFDAVWLRLFGEVLGARAA